jgi:hypothetical protein
MRRRTEDPLNRSIGLLHKKAVATVLHQTIIFCTDKPTISSINEINIFNPMKAREPQRIGNKAVSQREKTPG